MDVSSKDIKKNIKRTIEIPLKECLFKNKTIVLYGARQVGKTTLVKKIESEFRASGDKRIQYLNCDLNGPNPLSIVDSTASQVSHSSISR